MDVVLPNGVTISGIPDGTTKEQVMQKAIQAGLAKQEDFGAPTAEKGMGQKIDDAILSNPIGRGVAELASSVNRGAVGVADFLSSPVRYAVNAIDQGTLNPMEGFEGAAMNPLGYEMDQTPLSTRGNFMQDGLAKDVIRQGGEMIPAAIGGGAVFRSAASQLPAMASGAESVGAGVLRQMGSSTAAQDAGYAALSGAGQAIGQEVGGDTGAMVGAVVAPLAPVAVKGAFSGAMRSIFGSDDTASAAKVIDDFASFGETPTVGMASGKKGLQGAENISSRAMGGGPLAKKSESIALNMQKRLSEIADDISTKEGAESAGLEIQKGIAGRGGFLDRFRSKSSVLWNKVDELVDPALTVDPVNTKSKLDQIVRGGAVGDILDNPKLKQIKQVFDNTETLTYKDIRDLRSMIGAKIGNNELVSDIPRAELKQIYGALSDDIKSVASASGDNALNAFKRANNFSRAGHERIDDYLERIVTKVDPDKVYAAVTKGGEGTKTVNAFKKSLKPEEWDVVVSNVVRRLGRSTSGQQTAVGDEALGDAFSVQKFVTDWDKLGPAKKALFSGSPKIETYGDDLAKIARAASVIKEASKVNANASGTAQAASRIAAGTGVATGLATANPSILAATAASVAMNNSGARLMSNPNFVKWLAQSANIPKGRSSAALGALVGVANQSSADDAAIIQQLAEELEDQQ